MVVFALATGLGPPPMKQWLAKATASSALAVACLSACVPAANAENELEALGAKGFDASLVDTACITGNCERAATSCMENSDCRKGMTCTAKCLGDNACITGCFAKYGNSEMNSLLECTVEKNGCVKIAILPAGPAEPTTPPVPLEPFDPRSLEGNWYKVLGWNSRYDCFDCQMNSFEATRKKDTMKVDVQFAMPKPGGSNAMHLEEDMHFEFQNGKLLRRHASSVGHLFGLTFWENWSVIGQNKPGQPEWKFVYYTGKTTQNTYEGAFVYSRTKELPESAKKDVYALAKRANIEPSSFCQIRNDKETCDVDSNKSSQPVFVDDSPANKKDEMMRRLERGLFVGVATAAEDDSPPPQQQRTTRWYDSLLTDIADYLEDPRATSRWVFGQQRKVASDYFASSEAN